LYKTFLDDGVDGFWNDMNEPAAFAPKDSAQPAITFGPLKTFPLDAQHNGDGQPGPHARYHNVYGMQMARATNEGLSTLRPDKRPMVLTRAGYAGVQRYAAVWTGDNSANWLHVALTIPMLTNLGASGVPFVGADVGGFVGTPSAELYTRWLQAAALTPFFRTHSAIDSEQREPWSFGADFERINRASIELRYQLLPTIYSLFAESEKTGIPPLRALWFVYPNDVKAALIEDEYLVGNDLLVAPVVTEGALKRQVYFPKGDTWIDWWSGVRYAGGKAVVVDAPLDRLPLYVRAGGSLATQPVIQHTGEMKNVPLTIVAALGADGNAAVYQDAGDGYAYRNGASRITQVALRKNALRLQIPKSSEFQKIGFVEFIGVDAQPKSVKADGNSVRNAAFDAKTKRLRVALPDESVKEISLEM
jgi:alpha-glucosidase